MSSITFAVTLLLSEGLLLRHTGDRTDGYSMCSAEVIITIMCVVLSYIYIVKTILRFPSAQQRKKVFSTCSSHMIAVSITWGSSIFIYVKPSAKDEAAINKGISLHVTSMSPMLNPFIYTQRNKHMKQAFLDLIKKAELLSKM